MSRKVRMLKLFSIVMILQVINFLSYIFIFRKQFNFIPFGLKIIGHENTDNNLESPCILYKKKYIYIHSNKSDPTKI
jgi:hypothetical protein